MVATEFVAAIIIGTLFIEKCSHDLKIETNRSDPYFFSSSN